MRIFLDSNVIISGLYSSRGAPAAILEYYVRGQITLVVSRQVIEEVIRTLRGKLPEALPALRRLLVNVPPEVLPNPNEAEIEIWLKLLSKPDATIIAAALAAQPDYFVTGDNHFLANPKIEVKSGLQIITPAQFLERLERGEKR